MANPKFDEATLDRHKGTTDSYEGDFYAWITSQTRALREVRWDELDWENLAEEIESVGRNDKRAIESHLKILLAHLLKCLVQPERRTDSWDQTIRTQREEIQALLRRSPSLGRLPVERFGEAYESALRLAARDTGISETKLPQVPPFSLEETLSPSFFPAPPRRGAP
jgi:hypothetical protein